MAPDQRMQAVAGRIQALVDSFAASPDPEVRQRAQELVRLLMELYGAGLGRILRILERVDGPGGRAAGALLDDELVASLLVLHDLHPEDPAARIRRELERVQALTGTVVDLLGLSDTTARLRIGGRRPARPIAAPDLQGLVEAAVQAAAPDVVRVEVEGLAEAAPPPLVQLTRTPPADRTDAARVR